MIKTGIYVDAENIMRGGGWGMRYDVLRSFVECDGDSKVVRANAYIAVDRDRESVDVDHRRKKHEYRAILRECGFRLVPKTVKRYTDEDGGTVTKANSDLDLAIDAVLQARKLDRIVLLTGDGDFVRVVTAVQDFGCRVDVIAFHGVNGELRDVADSFHSGFLVPGLLPITPANETGWHRGFLYSVNEARFFGFMRAFLDPEKPLLSTDGIMLHGSDLDGGLYSPRHFGSLRGSHNAILFRLEQTPKGLRAKDARRLVPERPEPTPQKFVPRPAAPPPAPEPMEAVA
jgi:uncharacterized LabA/DUF88 family protein